MESDNYLNIFYFFLSMEFMYISFLTEMDHLKLLLLTTDQANTQLLVYSKVFAFRS